jgi:hypothetical protein
VVVVVVVIIIMIVIIIITIINRIKNKNDRSSSSRSSSRSQTPPPPEAAEPSDFSVPLSRRASVSVASGPGESRMSWARRVAKSTVVAAGAGEGVNKT